MAHLTLSFLGGFEVEMEGRPLKEFKSNKVRALLAFLAVEAARPQRREMLAGLLWPNRTNRDALSNLRYSLAKLRGTLGDRSGGPSFLLISPDAIQFNQASDHWLDVAVLEKTVAAARVPGQTDTDDLKSAIALYRGGFLDGFSVADAAPFEEWALLRREQLAQQVTWALASLATVLEARGDYAQAQVMARRHVTLEPWNEDAHRSLMRVLALDERRSAALHQFQVCRRILAEELGVEPAEETTALFEAIRKGGWVDREIRKPWATAGGTAGASAPTPPVVARENQLSQLDSALAAALAGAGRVVFVAGEAGSGKTALLGEFTRRALQTHAGLLVARGACDAATGVGDPHLPFREILQLLTGDIEAKRAGATLTPEHARRLWAAMPDAVEALLKQGPNLIDTFVPGASLDLRSEAFARQVGHHEWQAGLHQLLQSTANDGRSSEHLLRLTDVFEQVTHVLQVLARRHPLCLLLDDLQWADAGSVSLLFHLGRRIATSRILVVAAYRPDTFAGHVESKRHPLELVVNELQRISGQEPINLDACEGRPLVEALLDSEQNHLSAAFRDQLLQHTEGHPLFTVELLGGMKERGDLVRDSAGCWTEGPALHWDKLPARVGAAIAERIGRLPEQCRSLLDAASIEGEEFTAEVVARVLDLDEASIVCCLSSNLGERHHLVTAVSMRRLGARRISRYRFRHYLFQRYLYDHLDAIRRAYLHETVGSVLEALYGNAPDELDVLAPRLAWHFEMAGLADRAAAYYLRAGNRSTKLAAYEEAIDHLTRGLTLLEALPDSPQRVRLNMDMQMAMVSPITLARGFGDPERIHALKSACETSHHPTFDESSERWAVSAYARPTRRAGAAGNSDPN